MNYIVDLDVPNIFPTYFLLLFYYGFREILTKKVEIFNDLDLWPRDEMNYIVDLDVSNIFPMYFLLLSITVSKKF